MRLSGRHFDIRYFPHYLSFLFLLSYVHYSALCFRLLFTFFLYLPPSRTALTYTVPCSRQKSSAIIQSPKVSESSPALLDRTRRET